MLKHADLKCFGLHALYCMCVNEMPAAFEVYFLCAHDWLVGPPESTRQRQWRKSKCAAALACVGKSEAPPRHHHQRQQQPQQVAAVVVDGARRRDVDGFADFLCDFNSVIELYYR